MNELTPDQLAGLRNALESLRDDLVRLLEATHDGSRTVDLDEPIGRLTRIDAIQQQRMTAANRRDHDLRLRQVLQALTAIEQNRYGLCRRCEHPIGYQRLQARPESPYCLDCQNEIDQRFH